MRLLAVLVLALLPACTIFGTAPQLAVPTNLSEAGREAAKAINEVKVDLISVNNAITSQVKAGLMGKEEATRYATLVDSYWAKVKEVEALLGSGKDLLAKDQAKLLSTALIALQKEVLARSKK